MLFVIAVKTWEAAHAATGSLRNMPAKGVRGNSQADVWGGVYPDRDAVFRDGGFPGRLWEPRGNPSPWGDPMKRRVLIVDDEPQIRDMLREWLTRSGYEVSDAPDGKQAIEILRKQSFDVVVADILMPEKDGLEVIMYLQRESPLTKCVAISSPSNRVFLQSAQLLGATKVVEKPFTGAEVETAIREALDAPR